MSARPEPRKLILVPGGDHRSVQHDAELQSVALGWLGKRLAGAASARGLGRRRRAGRSRRRPGAGVGRPVPCRRAVPLGRCRCRGPDGGWSWWGDRSRRCRRRRSPGRRPARRRRCRRRSRRPVLPPRAVVGAAGAVIRAAAPARRARRRPWGRGRLEATRRGREPSRRSGRRSCRAMRWRIRRRRRSARRPRATRCAPPLLEAAGQTSKETVPTRNTKVTTAPASRAPLAPMPAM